MFRIKLLERLRENLNIKVSEKEEELKKLKERNKVLEQDIDNANTEEELKKIEEEVDKNLNDIKSLEDAKLELRTQINDINEDLKKLNTKMPKVDVLDGNENRNIKELRENAERYIRSKGTDDKITSTEVGVLIPKDVKTTPVEVASKIIDLKKYVTTIKVNTGSGTYPILKRSNAILATTEELEKNPSLAKPEFIEVDWKAKTYRGAIPISQESIDDAECDILRIVENQAEVLKINTENKEICEILKKFTAKECKSLDDIIAILDVDLNIAYRRVAIMTQSFFNKLHIIKDKTGRYMFDKTLISNSQNVYIPVTIEVVPDTFLGKENEAKAFIGDSEQGVLLVERNEISVKWVEHDVYGQYLRAALRFDTKQADENAGYFVTLNLAEV